MSRVYLPATLTLLGQWVAAGAVAGPLRAHAVTPTLRAELPDGDEEEWEYTALLAAAQDALGLLDPGDPPRRVVLAADVPTAVPVGPGEVTAVDVTEPVPLASVAAVHVDGPEAEVAVTTARSAWRRLEAGDGQQDDLAAVERCLDHDLGWYATQEIATLLA